MATEFKDQGGFATSNPSALVRWIGSKVATRLASVASLERRRAWAEKKRRRAGRPHRIEYFHQVDDGYSHLAAQLLRPILESYDVELVFHLVASDRGPNQLHGRRFLQRREHERDRDGATKSERFRAGWTRGSTTPVGLTPPNQTGS
jgi:hypothetical protein